MKEIVYQISCICQITWVKDNKVVRVQMISSKHLNIKNQIKSMFERFATRTV